MPTTTYLTSAGTFVARGHSEVLVVSAGHDTEGCDVVFCGDCAWERAKRAIGPCSVCGEPVIISVHRDQSIDDLIVTVEPYRVATRSGAVVVAMFYGNGSLITAEGWKIKKDGTPSARRQVVPVPIPANVRKALGR